MSATQCPSCRSPVAEGVPFCPHCGAKLHRRASSPSQGDPYEILQVSRNADQTVIEAAYKSLAKKYHPDSSSGHSSLEQMKRLNWAYETLKNPAERAQYDQGVSPQAPPKPKPQPPKPSPPKPKPKPSSPRPQAYKSTRKAPPPKPKPQKTQAKGITLNALVVITIATLLFVIALAAYISRETVAATPRPSLIPPTARPTRSINAIPEGMVRLQHPLEASVKVYYSEEMREFIRIPNGTFCAVVEYGFTRPNTGSYIDLVKVSCTAESLEGWVVARYTRTG